jgi:hypothetical protein
MKLQLQLSAFQSARERDNVHTQCTCIFFLLASFKCGATRPTRAIAFPLGYVRMNEDAKAERELGLANPDEGEERRGAYMKLPWADCQME